MIGYIVWHCVPFYEVNTSNMCSGKTLLNGDSVLYHWKFNEKYENVCIFMVVKGVVKFIDCVEIVEMRHFQNFIVFSSMLVQHRPFGFRASRWTTRSPQHRRCLATFGYLSARRWKKRLETTGFNDLGIPGFCGVWGNTETLSQAWLLGLARCLGLPYGMLGRHSQSQLDNLSHHGALDPLGSTWLPCKVLLRECAWRFDPRLVSKARCDQFTMTTVLCFPNLQSSFQLFSALTGLGGINQPHIDLGAQTQRCQMLSVRQMCCRVTKWLLRF